MTDVICKKLKNRTYIGEYDDKGIHGRGFLVDNKHTFAMGTFIHNEFTGFGMSNDFKGKLIFGNFKKGKPDGICCYQCDDHIYYGFAYVNDKGELTKYKVGIELYPNGDWVIAEYNNGVKNVLGSYYKASEKKLILVHGFEVPLMNMTFFYDIEGLANDIEFPTNNVRYLPSEYYEEYVPNQFEYSDEDFFIEMRPEGKKEGIGIVYKEHEFSIMHYHNDPDNEGEGDGLFYTSEQINNGDSRVTLGLHRFECFSTPDGDIIEDRFNEDLCLQYYQKENKYVLWNPVRSGPIFVYYPNRIEIVFGKDKVITYNYQAGIPKFNFPEPIQKPLYATFKEAFKADLFIYDKIKCIYKIGRKKALTRKDDSIESIVYKDEDTKKEGEKHLKEIMKECEKDEIKSGIDELDQYVGLENIKKLIPYIKSSVGRKDRKYSPNLNFIFAGNPGTGKTEVAHILGKVLYDCGVLSEATYIEKNAKAFEGASGVIEAFDEARGGVLFIDEAYSLITFTEDISESVNDRSGAAATQALVQCLEEYRGEVCVILAGYKNKMDELLKFNDGFASRIGHYVEFPNYDKDQLKEIAKRFFTKYGYTITKQNLAKFMNSIYSISYRHDFGNARAVRNCVEKVIECQNHRTDGTDDSEIKECDIDEATSNKPARLIDGETADKIVKKLVGLKSVKNELHKIKCFLDPKYTDPLTMSKINLNMVFAGNPGTGKTTVAKLVADILYDAKILPTNNLIVTDRSNFVSQWKGMTPIRTRNTFESALGGVLFIDEAYSICQGPWDEFGHQAIDMIIKLMSEYKGRVCVIFAGYPDEMRYFVKSNPGLPRRIGRTIEFPDFTPKEIEEILDLNLKEDGRELSKDARKLLLSIVEHKRHLPNFGNAGDVQNVLQGAYESNAVRNNGNRTTIELEDVKQYMKDRSIELKDVKKAKWASSLALIKKLSKAHQDNKFKFDNKYLETRVVSIVCFGFEKQKASGSGFFIDDQGTIVTNAHVVEGAVEVFASAAVKISKNHILRTTFPVDIIKVGSSMDKDVAILQIRDRQGVKFDYLPLESAKTIPTPLSDIAMAGYPLGEARFSNLSYNRGRIQSVNKDPELNNEIDYLLVDMTGQHGSSGSGVVDMGTGRVLGLFTRYAENSEGGITKLAMVVPSKYIWEMLEKIKR